MLPTNFLLQKIKKGSYSVTIDDRVTSLAFYNSPYGLLSVVQVSFNYLQYFERYALDKIVTEGWTDGQLDGW